VRKEHHRKYLNIFQRHSLQRNLQKSYLIFYFQTGIPRSDRLESFALPLFIQKIPAEKILAHFSIYFYPADNYLYKQSGHAVIPGKDI